ncbi:hypothetical protein HPB51_004628 [Rhipicephalus microplus]|uniref:Uncharacterized protein n=1 Tax=Rhipicephalus microplus TaxID=6941 RepID=A0A9J6DFT5_RHIMP|nr:hypothetical protein HPB51_004628 [Rhipicephalus microplus]
MATARTYAPPTLSPRSGCDLQMSNRTSALEPPNMALPRSSSCSDGDDMESDGGYANVTNSCLKRKLRRISSLRPFRALAIIGTCSEKHIAEEFCMHLSGSAITDGSLLRCAPPTADVSLDHPFTLQVLRTAVSTSQCSSAPGLEGITYATLRHVGTRATEELLSVYNLSWTSVTV